MITVTEKVKTYGYDGDADLPRLLVDAVQTFSEDLLSIPAEYRQTAEIDFEPGYEYGESYARRSASPTSGRRQQKRPQRAQPANGCTGATS